MACKTFHKGRYYVTFKRGFEDYRKDITIIIDKVFENDSLRISMSDDDDPTFLCVVNVNHCDYEDLKKQQGLLIDFGNFPSQLVKLLQQCASNNMFLNMQLTNPLQYYFEIVEHNEFKRLVHLSLKTGPATDNDIKQHMADTITNLKKTVTALKSSASTNEAMWSDKCINFERKIHDLTQAISKFEEDKIRLDTEFQETLRQEKDKLAQEKLYWQRNIEMNTKAQIAAAQENLNRKDKQIEELNTLCKQSRENILQLENQLSEKLQRLSLLEKEVQKSHIEVATLNAKNATLEREITEKDKQCNQLNSKCVYLEKTIKDNTDIINDLNNKLQLIKKEKTGLEERLALSESLATKSNEAAHTASEQLLKANQIISKQNADLIEMKEKLLCRTAIALEQEKVIESNTKEIEELKSEVSITKENIDKLKNELDSLKEKYETNEKTLKDRDETIKNNNMVIQWLHKKMEENCAPSDVLLQNKPRFGIQTATSSTPYFIQRPNQTVSSQHVSDESINFYETSKLTNLEDNYSQTNNTHEKNGKVGLDPKYLEPAVDDNKIKKCKDLSKEKNVDIQSQQEKENKNINLPKVNYREKKSSKSTTYRATPISAYFP